MMYSEAFMRRSRFFAGLAVLAAAISLGHAQGTVVFHGIPASVTSGTVQNPTPGIAPSVTSATVLPTPFPQFSQPFFFTGAQQPFFHHRHHFVPVPVPVPVYYPFYSYPVAYGDEMQQQPQPEPVVEVVETPAPSFESSPRYEAPAPRPSYTPPAASKEEPRDDTAAAAAREHKPAKQDASTPEAEPITILVFRDGHQMEIGNYAIVGDTLYDLAGNYKTHKIMLADLDLEKTVKVNEDRGYDFRLPQQGN
jgi:hypothetical protein